MVMKSMRRLVSHPQGDEEHEEAGNSPPIVMKSMRRLVTHPHGDEEHEEAGYSPPW